MSSSVPGVIEEAFRMGRSYQAIVFSHGKESGPWGSKILAMAEIARGDVIELDEALKALDIR